MKKISFLILIPFLLLSSLNGYAQEWEINTYSYSADLKDGDSFVWSVAASTLFSDTFFTDGSEITLKVLQDLSGVSFSGNISASAISEYFEVNLDTSEFDFLDLGSVNLLVFPTSITFENDTTINPTEGFWIDEILNTDEIFADFDMEGDASVDIDKSGDLVTFRVEIVVKQQEIPITLKFNATIDSKLGVMESYSVLLETPIVGDQTLVLTKKHPTSTSSPSSNDEKSDDEPAPLNTVWFILPFLIAPLIKKYRNKS